MSLNYEMALFNRADSNVEPLLEPSARNRPRTSCGRAGRKPWHHSTERRSDPQFADFALNSMDARRNFRMDLDFLVVRKRTRAAAEHTRSPTARSPCTIAVEARMDMGANCRNAWDYRHDRHGVRDGASSKSTARGVSLNSRFILVQEADNIIRMFLY